MTSEVLLGKGQHEIGLAGEVAVDPPEDSPLSSNRSCMDLSWKPSRRRQRRLHRGSAASRVRICWLTFGMWPTAKKKTNFVLTVSSSPEHGGGNKRTVYSLLEVRSAEPDRQSARPSRQLDDPPGGRCRRSVVTLAVLSVHLARRPACSRATCRWAWSGTSPGTAQLVRGTDVGATRAPSTCGCTPIKPRTRAAIRDRDIYGALVVSPHPRRGPRGGSGVADGGTAARHRRIGRGRG